MKMPADTHARNPYISPGQSHCVNLHNLDTDRSHPAYRGARSRICLHSDRPRQPPAPQSALQHSDNNDWHTNGTIIVNIRDSGAKCKIFSQVLLHNGIFLYPPFPYQKRRLLPRNEAVLRHHIVCFQLLILVRPQMPPRCLCRHSSCFNPAASYGGGIRSL